MSNSSFTQFAIPSPVSVSLGGTGDTTLTAYAPLFGGTTNTAAVQSGSVGSTGQVLTSNGAGALPTFQAVASTGGALTQIGTTQTPTGVSTVTFNNIPQTYSALLLKWQSISSDTATRAINVAVDTATTFATPLTSDSTYNPTNTTVAGGNGNSAGLLTNAPNQTAAQTSSGVLYIQAYRSTANTVFMAHFITGSATNIVSFIGRTTNQSAAIQSLQILWNGSGNFDAGTIQLWGVA